MCDVCAHSLIGGDLMKILYANAFIVVSFLPLPPLFPGQRKGARSLRSASGKFFSPIIFSLQHFKDAMGKEGHIYFLFGDRRSVKLHYSFSSLTISNYAYNFLYSQDTLNPSLMFGILFQKHQSFIQRFQ